MSNLIDTLREKRNKILADMRGMITRAEKEKRNFTALEEASYDAMDDDFQQLTDQLEEARNATNGGELVHLDGNEATDKIEGHREVRVYLPGEKRQPVKVDSRQQQEVADWHTFLRKGLMGLSHEQKQRFETRALQADSDVKGGYLIAPEYFQSEVIQQLDNEVFMRRLATVVSLKGSQRLTAPSLDTDVSTPTWGSEITTGSEDSSLSFEKRALEPHPLAMRIKVSNELLNHNPAVGTLVRERFGYKFGIAEETAYMTGNGANKPLGIFTAHDAGLPASTSYDISSGNTATSIKADGLIECVYSLESQYRRGAQWIFHRDALKQIRKLKDGEGQYLWQAGFVSGRPDTILGFSYNESEYAPSTFTTGLYVGCLGNFKHYWIVESLPFQVVRLDELYAETNQVGFIGRRQVDGCVVLPQAFRRVTLA